MLILKVRSALSLAAYPEKKAAKLNTAAAHKFTLLAALSKVEGLTNNTASMTTTMIKRANGNDAKGGCKSGIGIFAKY